jgi:adenine/guanine phosphoribosyltransferase-like PRPP-binding protein
LIPRSASILIGAVRIGIELAAAVALFSGCAFVPQVKREYLSDPIMQRQEDGLESGLEGHDFPRREGSVGGSSGSGGGCGC